MQISKINNINFKGLWGNKRTIQVAQEKEGNPKVYYKEKVYYPFSDEKPEEIRETMRQARKAPVWMANSYYELDHYVIIKHTLGDKLHITKKDYEEMTNPEGFGCPLRPNINEGVYDYMPGVLPKDSERIGKILRVLDIK